MHDDGNMTTTAIGKHVSCEYDSEHESQYVEPDVTALIMSHALTYVGSLCDSRVCCDECSELRLKCPGLLLLPLCATTTTRWRQRLGGAKGASMAAGMKSKKIVLILLT